jgi:hypothetical protein
MLQTNYSAWVHGGALGSTSGGGGGDGGMTARRAHASAPAICPAAAQPCRAAQRGTAGALFSNPVTPSGGGQSPPQPAGEKNNTGLQAPGKRQG